MENELDPLSEETIEAVIELGKVLQKIHSRLISESYTITKDEIVDPEGKVVFSKIKK